MTKINPTKILFIKLGARGILMTLGKRVRTRDGILEIELNEWLQPIKNVYPELEAEYRRLEPALVSSDGGKNNDLDALRLRWRGGSHLIRTLLSTNLQNYVFLEETLELKAA